MSPSKSSKKYAPVPALEVTRYGPSQFGPSFPHAGFFAEPTTFLNTWSPSHLGPKVLSLHGRHNLASASVDNEPIEPSRFPLFSSIKSRPLARFSSLSFGLNELVLVVGNPDSKGMTASAP